MGTSASGSSRCARHPSRGSWTRCTRSRRRTPACPVLELMWGLPGSMLACVHLGAITGDPRFEALFRTGADRLFAELEATDAGPIWTQDLYGRRQRYLGPVHGFAGNALPLIHGWRWLTPRQRAMVAEGVPRTLGGHA